LTFKRKITEEYVFHENQDVSVAFLPSLTRIYCLASAFQKKRGGGRVCSFIHNGKIGKTQIPMQTEQKTTCQKKNHTRPQDPKTQPPL